MNTRLLFLACAASLVLSACSDTASLPTEPAASPMAVKAMTQPMIQTPAPGSDVSHAIHVDLVLADPVQSKEQVDLVANVFWAAVPSPILGRDLVTITLTFDGQATLSTFDGPVGWLVAGKTTETIDPEAKNPSEVEEVYAVRGSPEPMSLHVRYILSERDVRMETAWLTTAAVGLESGR